METASPSSGHLGFSDFCLPPPQGHIMTYGKEYRARHYENGYHTVVPHLALVISAYV